MLFDIRTYTCAPNRMKDHLALYEEFGLPAQRKHLGDPYLYAAVETGNPNQYVHIWAYESAADREVKRAAMWSDPDWLSYVEKSAALGALEKQENILVKSVSFFTPKV